MIADIVIKFASELAKHTGSIGPLYIELPYNLFERLYMELNSQIREPSVGYPEITINTSFAVINIRPSRK